MSKNILIIGELKTVSSFGDKELKDYIFKANSLQQEVEDALDEYFLQDDNGLIASEIMKEHLREAYAKDTYGFVDDKNGGPVVAYCSKLTTYKNAKVIVEHLIKQDVKNVVGNIIQKHEDVVKNLQKASLNNEFILYVRGYVKYWKDKIEDENAADIDAQIDDSYWKDVLTDAKLEI